MNSEPRPSAALIRQMRHAKGYCTERHAQRDRCDQRTSEPSQVSRYGSTAVRSSLSTAWRAARRAVGVALNAMGSPTAAKSVAAVDSREARPTEAGEPEPTGQMVPDRLPREC